MALYTIQSWNVSPATRTTEKFKSATRECNNDLEAILDMLASLNDTPVDKRPEFVQLICGARGVALIDLRLSK
jgi:hypothetical protein